MTSSPPPASEPPHAAAAADATAVLIVDDEEPNRTSIEKIFRREQMRTFVADGAKQALEILRTHRVQVVLTDLMLPGTSGLELLKGVKEVSPTRRTGPPLNFISH